MGITGVNGEQRSPSSHFLKEGCGWRNHRNRPQRPGSFILIVSFSLPFLRGTGPEMNGSRLGWHMDDFFFLLSVVKFNSPDKTPLGKGKGEVR